MHAAWRLQSAPGPEAPEACLRFRCCSLPYVFCLKKASLVFSLKKGCLIVFFTCIFLLKVRFLLCEYIFLLVCTFRRNLLSETWGPRRAHRIPPNLFWASNFVSLFGSFFYRLFIDFGSHFGSLFPSFSTSKTVPKMDPKMKLTSDGIWDPSPSET